MVPGLEERMMEGSEEDVSHIADMVRGLHPFPLNVSERSLLVFTDTERGIRCAS